MFQSLFRLSDAALTTLFTFLAKFFSVLNRTVGQLPEALISKLPRNVQSARIQIGAPCSNLFVAHPAISSIQGKTALYMVRRCHRNVAIDDFQPIHSLNIVVPVMLH